MRFILNNCIDKHWGRIVTHSLSDYDSAIFYVKKLCNTLYVLLKIWVNGTFNFPPWQPVFFKSTGTGIPAGTTFQRELAATVAFREMSEGTIALNCNLYGTEDELQTNV